MKGGLLIEPQLNTVLQRLWTWTEERIPATEQRNPGLFVVQHPRGSLVLRDYMVVARTLTFAQQRINPFSLG